MVEIPNVSTRSIPVTPEAVADLPDQPLAEGTAGLPELSAHVAVMSRKGKKMPEENAWAWWQSALANPAEIGKSLPVHDGDPQQGYYRTRFKGGKWEPVAIWFSNEGWLALRSDRQVSAEDIWTFCCRNPITFEAYEKASMTGEWDDEPEAKPRGIGDNLPSDPFEALTLEFDGEKELAGEFLKTPITEQSQADRAAVLSKRIAAIAKKATDLHKVEKQPHLDAGRAVDDKWRPLKEEPDALSKRLKRHMDDYLREQQRIEQERQRAAAAEAERLRNEAEEAARAARQSENEYEQAKADRLAREATEAEREAQAKNAAAGRTGAKVSLRKFVSAKVTDYHAAAKALVDMQHKEFLEFIDQLANRAIRADKTLAGVERVEEQRAA
jgi:hypothetical protein